MMPFKWISIQHKITTLIKVKYRNFAAPKGIYLFNVVFDLVRPQGQIAKLIKTDQNRSKLIKTVPNHSTTCRFTCFTMFHLDLNSFIPFWTVLNGFIHFPRDVSLILCVRESRCRPRRPPPAVPIDAYFRESDHQSKVKSDRTFRERLEFVQSNSDKSENRIF